MKCVFIHEDNPTELVCRLFSPWAFCWGNQDDANFWAGLWKTSDKYPIWTLAVWGVLTSTRGRLAGALWGLPSGYWGPLCEDLSNFTWTFQISVSLNLRMISHWWLQSAREWCREGCRLCCSGGRRDWSLGSAPCSSSTTPAGETKQLAWLSLNV